MLDQWSRSHLVDEGLVMTLAGLHMRDAIRHVHGCQFLDNSSLNAAHEPVLSSKDQVQVLSRKLSAMPLSEVRAHGLKVQVQLLIKFRRNMAMVRLEELVVIATQQPCDPLGELEVVVTESSKIPKARQFSTPDGELPALARSRGEKVPSGIPSWSQGRFSRRLRSTRSRGRSTCHRRLLLGHLRGRLRRRRSCRRR